MKEKMDSPVLIVERPSLKFRTPKEGGENT